MAKSLSNMDVDVLEFVEQTDKTESTKPHPLNKFSQFIVDTPPLPVRKPVNEELMDQAPTGRCMIITKFAWCFCISS